MTNVSGLRSAREAAHALVEATPTRSDLTPAGQALFDALAAKFDEKLDAAIESGKPGTMATTKPIFNGYEEAMPAPPPWTDTAEENQKVMRALAGRYTDADYEVVSPQFSPQTFGMTRTPNEISMEIRIPKQVIDQVRNELRPAPRRDGFAAVDTEPPPTRFQAADGEPRPSGPVKLPAVASPGERRPVVTVDTEPPPARFPASGVERRPVAAVETEPPPRRPESPPAGPNGRVPYGYGEPL